MQNILDKAIAWINPEAGRKRVLARKMTEAVLAYEGVRPTRRQGGWYTTGSSGNSEIGVARSKLAANARDLCRNNAYARKAKREWAKRVVGYGIKPRPDTGNKRLNDTIMGYWNPWGAQCCSDQRLNIYALEKLIVSSCYESGEVLIRTWDRPTSDGLVVPLQLQVLEADYIDDSKTQTLTNGYIIQGVQFDSIGRITGYWLFGNHPGEVITTSIRGIAASKFIPAQYILHHAEIDRPGDVRAVTRFAAVIPKLREIDEYADAKLMRGKIEACMVGSVTQPEGAGGPTLGEATLATDGSGLKVEEFHPGMMIYGAPGVEVAFNQPTSTADYSAYKKTELREVAAGLEIPYVILDDNLEAVNYSSYRGGLLAFRDAIEEYRWNWLIPQVLDPIWELFINKLYAMGVIPEANYAVKWDPPPFDLLDREAEAKADRLELQIGKKSYPQLISEQGNDPDEQISEITKYKPLLDAAGVTFAQNAAPTQPQEDQQTPDPAQGDKDNAKQTE